MPEEDPGFDTHVPGANVSPREPVAPAVPELAAGGAPDAPPVEHRGPEILLPKALVPEGAGVGLNVKRGRPGPPSSPRVRVASAVVSAVTGPGPTPAQGVDSSAFRPPREPETDRHTWFLAVLRDALALPFLPSSLIASLGGGVLLAAALLFVEAAPQLGAMALLVVLAELSAIRLKTIRESAAGHPGVVWPDWDEGLAALPLHGASLLLFAPAAIAALVAWGPAAWDRTSPASIPATVRRTLVGEAERAVARAFLEAKKPGGVEPKPVDYLLDPDLPLEPEHPPHEPGDRLLSELTTAGGVESHEPTTSPRKAFARALERGRFVLDLRASSGAAFAARVLLLLGALLFPIGLLLAARVQNARAVLDPRLLLRPIVREPVAYAVVLALFLAQDALIGLAFFVGEPLAFSVLGHATIAHVVAVGLGCCLALTLSCATGAAIGGFARGRRVEL